MKVERCDIFNQIWQIIHQEEENFGFSNYIYKLYLNFLKEHIIPTEVETEQKYYDYLSILLKNTNYITLMQNLLPKEVTWDFPN